MAGKSKTQAKKPARTKSKTAASRVRAPSRRASKRRRKAAQQVVVRHYCQGLGDCHLLKFTKENGDEFWMLIDCGVHTSVKGGPAMIDKIVDSIASTTDRLDVVVVTHEHWDHVSGFLTAEEKFKQFRVEDVWMAWTENPADRQARELDKFKGHALHALQEASRGLERASGLTPRLSAIRDGLQSVLGFSFGAKGEKVRAARDAAAALAKGKLRYLEPKDQPISLPGIPNLRVYVLGPPRDARLLGIHERPSEMYELRGAEGWPIGRALSSALALRDGSPFASADYAAPFDPSYGTDLSRLLDPNGEGEDVEGSIIDFMRDHYLGPAKVPAKGSATEEPDAAEIDQSWRRIDMDWYGAAADLAIQLDSRTNNSSLALAFEFVDTGRVMLFVADAQVGSWLSWHDLSWTVDENSVTGPDLLARTVYYKVGHHGSHNATLKEKGLELMTSRDLSAFIPTNAADAQKVGWGEMPLPKILVELQRRCSGRVIRADDSWINTDTVDPRVVKEKGSIRAVRHEPGLYVEVDVA